MSMTDVESSNADSALAYQRTGTTKPCNVIILTGGLTGSSALAGLLAAAGYWSGQETFKKVDYDTFENAELIRLNRRLMALGSVGEEYTTYFQPEAIRRIECLNRQERVDEYRAFISTCESHAPWVWKDPRLWLTIRFWAPLIDWAEVRVLLLSRDPIQSWISAIQRRQIQTYGFLKGYNQAIIDSLMEFLSSRSIEFMPVRYEDLVMSPESETERIGRFVRCELTLDHLTASYQGPLRRKPKGWRDGLEAALIYAKNYGERIG